MTSTQAYRVRVPDQGLGVAKIIRQYETGAVQVWLTLDDTGMTRERIWTRDTLRQYVNAATGA